MTLQTMTLSRFSCLTVDPDMKQSVDNNTNTQHSRDNTEAFEVFWSVVRRE